MALIQFIALVKCLPGHKETIDTLKSKIHSLFAEIFGGLQISFFFSKYVWLFSFKHKKGQRMETNTLVSLVNRWLPNFCVLLFCLQCRKMWCGRKIASHSSTAQNALVLLSCTWKLPKSNLTGRLPLHKALFCPNILFTKYTFTIYKVISFPKSHLKRL